MEAICQRKVSLALLGYGNSKDKEGLKCLIHGMVGKPAFATIHGEQLMI